MTSREASANRCVGSNGRSSANVQSHSLQRAPLESDVCCVCVCARARTRVYTCVCVRVGVRVCAWASVSSLQRASVNAARCCGDAQSSNRPRARTTLDCAFSACARRARTREPLECVAKTSHPLPFSEACRRQGRRAHLPTSAVRTYHRPACTATRLTFGERQSREGREHRCSQ